MEDADLEHIWHPCSQMKDYENFKPLRIKRAKGSYIELHNGHKLIDAISSWWCKSLGHSHPYLKAAIQNQMDKFEHAIFANTTYDNIVKLSQRLTNLMPHLGKVFYAGDGSCAVEIALKMSLHAHSICGQPQRTKFLVLKNGYHGETTGALSVSDVSMYTSAYKPLLFKVNCIDPPYVNSTSDPVWLDASVHWGIIKPKLERLAHNTAAIILEPILQGAGGMRLYSQDFLHRLAHWAAQHNIHVIADEIMTGIGRTGKMLACEYAHITPDFVCLSKGLTSGWLPFSCVITTNKMYDLFYDDYEQGKSFLHSHTYSGNALGAALANATLDVIEEEQLCSRASELQDTLRNHMKEVQLQTGKLENIRGIGAVIAADLKVKETTERKGYAVFKEAVKRGALLRPLGNTIYWLPPLNCPIEVIHLLKDITQTSINACSC